MIPKHVTDNLGVLQKFANNLRGYFGAPVYLVGSALSGKTAEPRDWDIRIILEDEDFDRHFGDPQQWNREGITGEWTELRWRWSDACTRASKQGWRECGLNIDFQIYPRFYADAQYPEGKGFPRLKIDTRGEHASQIQETS
jgi:hypothetical protein